MTEHLQDSLLDLHSNLSSFRKPTKDNHWGAPRSLLRGREEGLHVAEIPAPQGCCQQLCHLALWDGSCWVVTDSGLSWESASLHLHQGACAPGQLGGSWTAGRLPSRSLLFNARLSPTTGSAIYLHHTSQSSQPTSYAYFSRKVFVWLGFLFVFFREKTDKRKLQKCLHGQNGMFQI